LKKYLISPPTLVALKQHKNLQLCISATSNVVSTAIVVERGELDTNRKVQYPVYFISEVLSDSKTRYFHNFACGSSQAMHHATKEKLAWRNLTKPRVSEGTRYPTTLEDQCLQMSGQVSLGSMPRGHGTKNWAHLWKTLSSTN
jgi:hypothetical protein